MRQCFALIVNRIYKNIMKSTPNRPSQWKKLASLSFSFGWDVSCRAYLVQLISLLIVTLCLHACSTSPQEQVRGLWYYSESGVDYKDTKSCVFNSDGSFKCDITEIGFTEQFGEALEYQSIGKWFFDNGTLELVYATTYAPEKSIKTRYSVLTLSKGVMVLKNQNGDTEEWHSTNGL